MGCSLVSAFLMCWYYISLACKKNKYFRSYFWKTKPKSYCSLHWLTLLLLTSTESLLSFSLSVAFFLLSLLLAPQHDQVAKLSDERITTPKKRKAPPPPISPLQVNARVSLYLSACISLPLFILMHVCSIFIKWVVRPVCVCLHNTSYIIVLSVSQSLISLWLPKYNKVFHPCSMFI